MSRLRFVRVSVSLIATFAVLLVGAAAATAETWTGETTVASSEGTPTPETTLVKAAAAYEPTAGSLSFAVVTSAPPQPEIGGKPNTSGFSGLVLNTTGACTAAGVEASLKEPARASILSTLAFESFYSETTTAQGAVGSPPEMILLQKTVADATTTFTAQSTALRSRGFNCAVINAVDGKGEGATKMVFPLAPPPLPPQAPLPTPPAPPAPAPAALSIAKLKPRTLKVDRLKTVKITVTNTGGTGAAQGSLRVKAPQGVVVKPEKQKLPALAPGASWTVSVRLELTEKAKQRSTLTLTGTAAGAATATGSLVLKLKPEGNAPPVRTAAKGSALESVEPQIGAWKGKTSQGFAVYFRVADGGVANVRITYRDAICGKASIHEANASLTVDETGHFSGVVYPANGGVELEGTFTGPRSIKGKIVAGESSGLPGCLGGSFSFTAHPKS